MLSFKTFLEESKEQEDIDGLDEGAEHEGLSEIFEHIMSNKHNDPKIAEYMSKHRNAMTLNESTKENVQAGVKSFLQRHKEAYGSEMGKPVTSRQTIIRNAINAHYAKPEAEQHQALKDAAARLGYAVYGDSTLTPSNIGARLAGGNSKTDTVLNNKLAKFKGRLTSRVSSYGGAPSSYTHYHDSSMGTSSEVNQCPNKTTGCSVGSRGTKVRYRGKLKEVKPSCLAMNGGYNFVPSQIKTQINSHVRNGEKTLVDHALLASHHFATQAKKAASTGTVHAIRGQTTDQQGVDIRNIANTTAKHVPEVAKHTVLFGYSKNPTEVLEAARSNKRADGSVPEYIVHSHPGPAYHQDDEGKLHLNPENIEHLKKLRAAHETARKEGLNISDYVVAGGKSLDKSGNAIDGTIHRQPKTPKEIPENELTPAQIKTRAKNSAERERFNNVDSSIKKMRYWDLHHSGELKPGEAESHHDEKTGTGYTTIHQGGKKLKIGYYDRNANVGDTPSGQTSYAKKERHDARYADAENKAPTSHVTAPVASTGNLPSEGAHSDALVHQMHVSYDMHGNKLHHSEAGMLHDAHPHLMQQAGYTYHGKSIPIASA